MFLDLWHRVLTWFHQRRRSKKPSPAAPKPPPAEQPPADREKARQALLRFYEKQRRKHDKFVTPQGELPEREHKPRPATQEVKAKLPAKPEPLPDAASPLIEEAIVDRHHEGGGKVLYKPDEMLGEFSFRDTILEQLDRYFFYLKRMKKRDADAYHLYRQVGASLLPYLANGSWNRERKPVGPREPPPLPPKFNQLRPSFGCFAYGADPETEKFERDMDKGKVTGWVPKFMYYHKYKVPPASVQPMGGGDIYTLTVWWDRADTYAHNKHGIPQQVPIYISADGKTIRPLKVIETEWVEINGHVRRGGSYSIPQRAWKFPKDYKHWAKDHDDEVEHFLTRIFLETIDQAENSHMSMTRIAVTKGSMTAVFSVNVRRTAYFFQDRDIEVTESGTRKRIFHMVAPHIRSDGTAVKMHFRGLRDFTWAGYRVHISIPGLDHLDINEIDIGAVDSGAIEDLKGTMSMKKLGAFLAEQIAKGKAA